MTVTTHMAPMGHYNRVADQREAAIEPIEFAHALGHHGQFGSLWPHNLGRGKAPDWWFDSHPLDHIGQPLLLSHLHKAASDTERWINVLDPQVGEFICINEEVWPGYFNPNSNWTSYGHSEELHFLGLDTLYRSQKAIIYNAVLEENVDLEPGEIPDIPVGASGLYLARRYDPNHLAAPPRRETFGLDFHAPQIYFRKNEHDIDFIARVERSLTASAHFPQTVPFISPFYEKTYPFQMASADRFILLKKIFADWKIKHAMIFLNCTSTPDNWEKDRQINAEGTLLAQHIMES